jgi:hypothetical protein
MLGDIFPVPEYGSLSVLAAKATFGVASQIGRAHV